MNTILLMTDFSENARNAIKFAIGTFGQHVEYILLNSFVVPEGSSFLPITRMRILEEQSAENLRKEWALIKAAFPDMNKLRVKLVAEWGEPINALHSVAQKIRIDLVIMGTKGATGLQKVFIGTVTASVIRKTPLPVIAVPENARPRPLKKIAFASDLGDKSENTLHPLDQIAKRFDSEIMQLNVVQRGGKSDEEVALRIEELNQSGYLEGRNKTWHTIEADDVAEGIDQFCKNESVDLLVVIARQKGFFDRIFNRSISQHLVYESDLPIMVLEDE